MSLTASIEARCGAFCSPSKEAMPLDTVVLHVLRCLHPALSSTTTAAADHISTAAAKAPCSRAAVTRASHVGNSGVTARVEATEALTVSLLVTPFGLGLLSGAAAKAQIAASGAAMDLPALRVASLRATPETVPRAICAIVGERSLQI